MAKWFCVFVSQARGTKKCEIQFKLNLFSCGVFNFWYDLKDHVVLEPGTSLYAPDFTKCKDLSGKLRPVLVTDVYCRPGKRTANISNMLQLTN